MDVSVVRTLQMLVIALQLLAVALRGGGWCKADWNHSVFVSYGSLPLAGASQTICLVVSERIVGYKFSNLILRQKVHYLLSRAFYVRPISLFEPIKASDY